MINPKILRNVVIIISLILGAAFVYFLRLPHGTHTNTNGVDSPSRALNVDGKPSVLKKTIWNSETLSELDKGELQIKDSNGKTKLDLQILIAKTNEERQNGLMFIEELGDRDGMLFIFEKPSVQSFWMKNTLISLDMIFINENLEIVTIHSRTEPNQIKGRYTSEEPVLYVLEIKGGLSEENEVEKGDLISLEQL